MDAVAGMLDGPRARGAFLLRSTLAPPWSLRIADEAPLTLVATVRGAAWVLPDDGEPVRLERGDVCLLRGPDPYTVADDPATEPQVLILPGQRCVTPEGREVAMRDLGVRTWGNSPGRRDRAAHRHLRARRRGRPAAAARAAARSRSIAGDALESPLVALLADEIVRDAPGQEAVLDRLLDLLLIAALRAWLARPEAAAPGWYRADADPVVGRALRLIHHEPARPWTVAELAGGGRRLARRAGAPLHRAGGRAADGVPRGLADRAGRRPAARAGRDGRLGRRAGRLRQPVRAQHGLQAPARRQPARAPHRGARRRGLRQRKKGA